MSWDRIEPAPLPQTADSLHNEPDRSPSLQPTLGENQARADLLDHEQHEALKAERLRATGLIFDLQI